MSTFYTDIHTRGFVAFAYPPALRTEVKQTVKLWKGFCALRYAVKKGLPYSNGADGVGYELKDGVGNKADRKENFDVTLSGQARLKDNFDTISSTHALQFVMSATSLVKTMKPIVLDFARKSEQAFGITGFADEVEFSEDAFFVRFIHYFGDRSVGEETATAHVDQSGFTLHLFESEAGLQCLSYDKKAWIDMPVSSGEIVIIPSMQMQLRSQGKVKALCHRVIATDETARAGRYSAVCFVQLKNTPKYDKNNHGRLQEKEPGFNYDLPFEQFLKLFKR